MIAYLITNTMNGKQYIGITKGSLNRRFKAHLNTAKKADDNIALYNAIRKYGVDAFTVEQIASSFSRKDLCALEVQLIAQYKTKAPNGYNLTDGGDGLSGYTKTPEQIAAHSARMKSYHANLTPEAKAAKNKAISEAKIGVPNLKLRGQKNAQGHVRSEAFKANASEKQRAFALANRDEMARRGRLRKSSSQC
jgi:group I intron endonuclease